MELLLFMAKRSDFTDNKNAHTYDQLPINLTWRRATASANVGARIRVV